MQKIGSVTTLLRYPVKSMQGETLGSTIITQKGLLGDRSFALINTKTNKIVSAKNPRKYANIFDFSAKFLEEPSTSKIPEVQITLPNKTTVSSSHKNINETVSSALNADVKLSTTVPQKVQLEEYVADIDEIKQHNSVIDADMPDGTFFDLGTIHILTTSTINKLKELYSEGDFSINRFRPNIVVSLDINKIGFVENYWVGKKIAIGGEVVLKIKEATPRCVMTTLEQKGLTKDINILKTAIKNNNGNIGVYADVIKTGTISTNDTISFIE